MSSPGMKGTLTIRFPGRKMPWYTNSIRSWQTARKEFTLWAGWPLIVITTWTKWSPRL